MGKISHDRAMQEAQWTPADALGWAAEQAKWPTRRFRVESQGVKSRLLTEGMANSVRNLRGGVIIVMIPKNREAAGLPSRRRNKYADLPVCPKCKAPPGKPCMVIVPGVNKPTKKAKKVHAARLVTPDPDPIATE